FCSHFVFFFFSSRRRHTRFSRDWSSDVCSSDLRGRPRASPPRKRQPTVRPVSPGAPAMPLRARCAGEPPLPPPPHPLPCEAHRRSEERRVGKECRSLGSPCHSQIKKEYR